METKTHWLQSPNKNYLGHWDLPENEDLTLTIKSAQWEEVKNPIINKSEAKRVVRFEEEDVKPLICNQTNAQSIIKSTGVKYMEDSGGSKISLYVSLYRDKRTKEDVDCIRIRTAEVTGKPKAKQKITPVRFKEALKAIESNEYDAEKLSAGFDLTEKQNDQLTALILKMNG